MVTGEMFNAHSNRRRRPRYVTFAAAIGIGAAIGPAHLSASCAIDSRYRAPQLSVPQSSSFARSAPMLVQDSDDGTDPEIPPDQIEKYIAVYTDMQRNRSLTIDAAAAKEGLSVSAFRELEQKIERDESAREHVRTELQAAVTEKP